MSRCGICHQIGEHDHEAHVAWRTEAAYRTLAADDAIQARQLAWVALVKRQAAGRLAADAANDG